MSQFAAKSLVTENNLMIIHEYDNLPSLIQDFRVFADMKRQISVRWDESIARWTLSTPNVGHRTPASPQPTNPTEVAMGLAEAA